ncbi:hypothetical protein JCM16303_004070 [Sporobolomyces ruberrimus]
MSTCTATRLTTALPSRPSKSATASSSNGIKSQGTQQSSAKTLSQRPITPPTCSSSSTNVGGLTPSIETIWKSFVEKGHDDVELLKMLLLTKSKEDERLTALDMLRTEQLRAANTMALHQYFYQYSAFYAAQQQQQAHLAQRPQQQQQQPGVTKRAPSPYSPTSPPPAPLPSTSSSLKPSTKRPRAASDASVASNDSSVSAASSIASSSSSSVPIVPAKKPRLAPSTKNASSRSPPPPPPPATNSNGSKPTHADVMELLRKKCQANQGGVPPRPNASVSSAAAPAPAPRKPSSSPPLRHSLLLRPAGPAAPGTSSSTSPPPTLKMPQVQPTSSQPLSPVVEEGTGSRSPLTAGGVDRLAMLLRAGELKAESD